MGAALTIALLAALLGQVWAAQVRLESQLRWLSAALLLNAMTLPAAMLLFGDSDSALGLFAGFAAILAASASGMGALIWLYRIEKLGKPIQRETTSAKAKANLAEPPPEPNPLPSTHG
jgi:hypothetical protein